MNEIYLVSEKLARIPESAFDSAEEHLGCALPPTFKEFMRQFGEGDICGYIRPYHPERIIGQTKIHAEYLRDGQVKSLGVTTEYARDLIAVADTIDSDLIFFHPSDVNTYILFPRHKSTAFRIGGSFEALVRSIGSDDVIVEPFEGYYFQPWNGFGTVRFSRDMPRLTLPEMTDLFSSISKADYVIVASESIDYFIRRCGAHLQYLNMRNGEYLQFIVQFDQASEQLFLEQFAKVFGGMGFSVSESYNTSETGLRSLG